MNLKALIRYRNVWMALSILMVMFIHSKIQFDNIIISTIQQLSYGGVDIFVFASGIGCYYSLNRNSDIAEFMKRRVIRIFPMYLCFMVVWLLYKRLLFEMPFTSMVGNLFSIQNFTGKSNEFNWYVSAMWLMYLLAPLFASMLSKMKGWRTGFATVLFLVIFSVSFWYSYTFMITIARIPIFFLGMLVAKNALEGFELKKKHIIVLSAASVVCTVILLYLFAVLPSDRMWLLGLMWYPFIIMGPCLCLIFSATCQAIEKSKPGKFVVTVLGKLGEKTFSVYLVHIFVLDIFENILVINNLCADNNLNRALLLIPTALGCILLELADTFFQKRIALKEKAHVER